MASLIKPAALLHFWVLNWREKMKNLKWKFGCRNALNFCTVKETKESVGRAHMSGLANGNG